MDVLEQLGENKHVYLVKLRSGQHAIVKLTQRYGREVHRAWAAAGVAPQLLEFVELPGGWRLVAMEWLAEPWQHLHDLPEEEEPEARAAALHALTLGHGVTVADSHGTVQRSVHGDARDVNVLVCRRSAAQQSMQTAPGTEGSAMDMDVPSSSGVTGGSGGQLPAGQGRWWQAMFVDFDWAGFEGISRYPLHMNHVHISWPRGAADNQLMLQQHDREFLQSMQLPPNVPYSFRFDMG